jgi:hypothetical protein
MTLQKEEGEKDGCGMQENGDIQHYLHKNIKHGLLLAPN